MRYCLSVIALSFISIASAQVTSVFITTNGSFTDSQPGNIETVAISSANGSVNPVGPATMSGSFTIDYGTTGNPLTGTFTFMCATGSLTVGYSTSYQTGATAINFNTTVLSGTGSFSNATGTIQLLWTETDAGQGGTFSLTGTGVLSGVTFPPLTTTSLAGDYFLRQIEFTTDNANNATDARSVFGVIAFDGRGGYTFSGQQVVGAATPLSINPAGTYTITPAGLITLTNPQNSALTINARFGYEAIVGASTDAPGNVFDLFVAIPVPPSFAVPEVRTIGAGGPHIAAPAFPNQIPAGTYHMVDFELTGASTGQVRVSGMSAQFDGTGDIELFQPLGHVASVSGGAAETGQQFIGSYNLNGDGTGTIGFSPYAGTTTPSNILLSGAVRNLYVSATGNVFLAATPGAHDILIGLQNFATQNVAFNGRYWYAGIEADTGESEDLVASASVASSVTTILKTARVHEVPVSTPGLPTLYNETQSLGYAPLTSGFGGGCHCGIGAAGSVFTSGGTFVLAGNGGTFLSFTPGVDANGNPDSPGDFQFFFGIPIPTLAATDVFMNPQGIVDSATYSPVGDYIAPGEFISIYGSGLAAGSATASSLPFPPSLGNVSVTFNGTPAPIYHVEAGLIICIVPYEVIGTVATVVVDNNGTMSNSVNLRATPTSPGVFAGNQLGFGDGAITHLDNSLVDTSNAAVPGEIVQMYMNGLGALTTPVADGNGFVGIDNAVIEPIVLVNGVQAPLSYWGLTEDAGLFQIDFTVPPGTPSGEQSIGVVSGDAITETVTIAVQ